jgi:hypothetical protein
LPLPFGLIVMTFRVLSKLGVPFHVAEIFCPEATVTGTLQPLIPDEPAVTVTLSLYRSPHSSCSA